MHSQMGKDPLGMAVWLARNSPANADRAEVVLLPFLFGRCPFHCLRSPCLIRKRLAGGGQTPCTFSLRCVVACNHAVLGVVFVAVYVADQENAGGGQREEGCCASSAGPGRRIKRKVDRAREGGI